MEVIEPGWKYKAGEDKQYYIVWWHGFHGSPSSKWIPEPGKYINVRNGFDEQDIFEIKKLDLHERHIIEGVCGVSELEVMRIL